jgi:hypothetical protein
MNSSLRILIHKRFKRKWEKHIIDRGLQILKPNLNIVRMPTPLFHFSNESLFNQNSRIITLVPSFSCFIRKGLPDFFISQDRIYNDFSSYNLFVEEAIKDLEAAEVILELNVVPIFQLNSMCLYVKEGDYYSNFGLPPLILKARLVSLSLSSNISIQRKPLIISDPNNLMIQYAIEFIKATDNRGFLVLFNRLDASDSGRLVLDSKGFLTIPESEEEDFWDSIEFNVRQGETSAVSSI